MNYSERPTNNLVYVCVHGPHGGCRHQHGTVVVRSSILSIMLVPGSCPSYLVVNAGLPSSQTTRSTIPSITVFCPLHERRSQVSYRWLQSSTQLLSRPLFTSNHCLPVQEQNQAIVTLQGRREQSLTTMRPGTSLCLFMVCPWLRSVQNGLAPLCARLVKVCFRPVVDRSGCANILRALLP